MALAPRADLLVGDWLVEPRLNRITSRDRAHHLRPRLMDLLVYLAQHAGQVVSRDEILDAVWRQRFVADSVLSRSVAELRQFLDDEAQQPRVIETIPKRGYRLIAPVRPARPAPAAPPDSPPARPSLVVLPFVDMTPERDQDYFCDGLAEELTNRLSQLPGLKVVARTSAFAFKGTAADVREIGNTLAVGHLLEGSVQRSGNRVRVTVQLIDLSDGCHAWSERFDHPAEDVFAVEDDIARAVVSVLGVRLSGAVADRVLGSRSAEPAAHELYLRGRHHAARRRPDALDQAIGCYERAIELAPDYAAAHAGIAECCCVMGFVGFRRPADVVPRAKTEAERALAIDPDLAEAHAVLAHVLATFEWRWEEAERRFLRALELSPGYGLARTWYSHLLTACGRFDEAIAQVERACECDPLSSAVLASLGLTLYYAREYDRAAECCLNVLAADPGYGLARFFLGRVYWIQGKWELAAEQFRLLGPAFPAALGYLAGVLRLLGRDEDADRATEELRQLSCRCHVSPLAFAAALPLSERDERLQWLTMSFDEREGSIALLSIDPVMDFLRTDTNFLALLSRLRLPHGPSAR